MGTTKLKIPYEFIATRLTMSWTAWKFGLLAELTDPRSAVHVANAQLPADDRDGEHDLVEIASANMDESIVVLVHARFGDVIEIREADGRGVRYSRDGKFIGFLEP